MRHVVGDAASVEVGVGYSWVSARVVGTIPAWPEPLVELELAADEAVVEDDVLVTATGAPVWVLCADGARAWGHPLRPGDSGSPVVDADGAVVGLASGNLRGQPLLVTLPKDPVGPIVATLRRGR